MEFPHLWQTSESGWKMQGGRWEFWSIQSLKKQMNPGDLGKFQTPFPTARVESRHAGVWVKERDVQLLDSLGLGTTGPSLWGDNVAKGRRRVSRLQPPASLLQTLPHVQTHGPCWWCWMLQLLWEIQANPIIGVWLEKATQEWKEPSTMCRLFSKDDIAVFPGNSRPGGSFCGQVIRVKQRVTIFSQDGDAVYNKQ